MEVQVRFNEAKATESAARILRLHGGQINYMKLIKLLYLVDRGALLDWGRTVTTDRVVSMDRGLVLSKILNLINEDIRASEGGAWSKHISDPVGFEVKLKTEAPENELSKAEEDLIDDVFRKFGHLTQWDLSDLHHKLPEWRDPEGSALPVSVADILRAEKRSEEEIQRVCDELASLAIAS